ncbi:MAG: hypothetical protein NTV15_02000, partial [Candidatus Bathyarchaeota archaeon]|nr:hypothetical protein [Candidatus Bathyarchaeota archaeon]
FFAYEKNNRKCYADNGLFGIVECNNAEKLVRYVEKKEHTKEELLKDLEEGRRNVLSLLYGMTDVDFDLKTPLLGGVERRKNGVYTLVSEIDCHGGQITLINGAYIRTNREMQNRFFLLESSSCFSTMIFNENIFDRSDA